MVFSSDLVGQDGGYQEKRGCSMDVSLQDYYDYLAVKFRKEYTRRYYYDTIRKLLCDRNKKIGSLTLKDIELWVAEQNRKHLSHNTVQNYIIRINLFLQWLKRDDWKLKRIGWKSCNRDILSLDEIVLIRETARRKGYEHYLVVLFITDLAGRPNEICKAKWSNIRGNKFFFDDAKTGDTYGFITGDFQTALLGYKNVRPVPKPEYSDYILVNRNGNKFNHKGEHVRTIVRQVISDTGIGRKITPYDLRASVGTQEFNLFVNPKVIQRKFRHRSLKTTMMYNHVDDAMAEDYANRGLIFNGNNKSLFPVSDEKPKINNRLSVEESQDLIENDGNVSVSFSFVSFSDLFFGQMGVAS